MVARLVLAAPASGTGKTTVATGLMAALTRRGLVVAPGKVGPDYIDPGYHSLATDRAGRNLDPVLVGEDLVAPLFLHGARGADVAVVEGVMGLFDGRGATTDGSTAHVARLLDAPVVLVVDASSQSRSVAALVHGFTSYDGSVRLAGVVLNRVGSDRHEALLRESLGDVPVLGVLRRDVGIEVPSRHLGLVPAAERSAEAVATVDRLAHLAERSLDVDALLALARSATPLAAEPWSPAEALADVAITGGVQAREIATSWERGRQPVAALADVAITRGVQAREIATSWERSRQAGGRRPVVAVAGGPAFTFSYAETTELLTAAGADVVVVDPLTATALPPGTTGLVVGGGFPEVHAAALSANTGFLADVRRHVDAGLPVHAECAGLLLLCRSLDGAPMAGALDVTAAMTPTLSLGYRDATAVTDSLAGPAGTRVTGHEFHRTAVDPRAGTAPAWRTDGADEGFATPTLLASYLHLHPAAVPQLTRNLVAAASLVPA